MDLKISLLSSEELAEYSSIIPTLWIMAKGLAIFLPAISNAVPWSGEVLIKSNPRVTLTPLKNPMFLLE